MSVKEDILTLLEQNRGKYLSGEEIASKISVTRSAVWKAIKSLQAEGYAIDGVTNKGYYLPPDTDMVSASGIKKYLDDRASHLRIEVYKTIGSTNDEAKKLALSGEPDGKVIVAEEQTAGRGRKGRSFFSPGGTGVYISILLRPKIPVSVSSLLTTAAAVAVAGAVEQLSGRETQIKWVNDIWMDGKKICGILTEASMSLESGGLDFAVVGIGVNITMPESGFPDELSSIASSVFGASGHPNDIRNRLAAEILNCFMPYCDNLEERSFLFEYRKRLFILGREITVVGSGENAYRRAHALDIDDDCHLLVRYEDGTTASLSSGEISILPY
ncbi:MAG: biotin--[acetyl-CoA-carboxylase] ligase [Oscillospiraceae bacterium]|nr:biotin--[acetyl-CoA-carboxylase] ligase [Oscillospiraceae bacterium]